MVVTGSSRRRAVLVGYGALVLVLGVIVYWRTDEPGLPHTPALNALLDTRWLVASGRLLVAVTIGYLLVSLGVRVRNGQWARSAGPVTTDPPPAQELADSQRELEARLERAKLTIEDLTQRLDRSLDARERLLKSVADSPSPASAFRPAAGGVPEDNDDDHA
jgi:hypothetical protein